MFGLIATSTLNDFLIVMLELVKSTFEIDDSLDVFPVHGIGGILGTVLTRA